MKLIILMFCLMSQAFAAPVLNQNMAGEGTFVTIWPDHADPDHFFFAPNLMKLSVDSQTGAKFHFTEFKSGKCERPRHDRNGRCQHKAMITSLMVAGYQEKQLADAQAGILRIRPNARFSPIPFLSSQVDFSLSLGNFIDGHDCAPKAGQAADEIPCTIILNRKGIETVKPFLNDGKILLFKFVYQIAGVIQEANGQYRNEVLDYGLTVNLGGAVLTKHAELDTPFSWE